MAQGTPEAHDALRDLDACRTFVMQRSEILLRSWTPRLGGASPSPSVQNLAQYLALRERDLRPLQERLSLLGLSSLGRAESRVFANLDAIRSSLLSITGDANADAVRPDPQTMTAGSRTLRAALETLAGRAEHGRTTRMLVALPSDAAEDPEVAGRLLDAGADLVRLNTAQGDEASWLAAVGHVRAAAEARGRDVRILADLPGAGIRTRIDQKSKRFEVGERLRVLRRPREKRDVGVSVPEVLDAIPIGATVSFDDGRLEARVVVRDPTGLHLIVTRARDGGERVRPNKGVGVPRVALPLNAPTPQDLVALDILAPHVDLFGLSFVRSADDVAWLQNALRARRAGARPGILAKIETTGAIRTLPEILVQGVSQGPFGVMIARGDLAVEIGFERLAEVQEELLWVCEAAHVPVVWATQVLETLTKTVVPLRAEITDAAMAERAEIVMLNKGAFQYEAIVALDDVLRRMEGHAEKKRPTLRALQAWRDLLPGTAHPVPPTDAPS